MKNVMSIVLKLSSTLAALALVATTLSANSACVYVFNQPKAPKEIEKFKKIA